MSHEDHYKLQPEQKSLWDDKTLTYAERVKKLGDKYPTVCVLPFIQYCTHNDGDLRMCNRSVGIPDEKLGRNIKVMDYPLDELLNRDFIKQARKDKLNGKKLDACKRCYVEEDAGLISKRMRENYRFWDASLPAMQEAQQNDGQVLTKPIYLDLKLGNTCNLACAYCHPSVSSSLMSDHVRMRASGSLPEFFNDDLTTSLTRMKDMNYAERPEFWAEWEPVIPYLDTVFFEGGEPTIQKTVKAFIAKMIDMGVSHKIKLKFTTNMTRLTEDWVQMLAKFKAVSLFCSIDGLGYIQEASRYGSSFADVSANFEMVLRTAPAHVKVHLLPAINVLNLETFTDFLRWKETVDVTNRSEIGVNPVYYPRSLCIKILPEEIRAKARADIRTFIATCRTKIIQPELERELEGVINFMDSPRPDAEEARHELKVYLTSLDSIRPKIKYVENFGHLWEANL